MNNYIILGAFDSRKYGAYVFAQKPFSPPKYVYKTQKLESSNGKHIYPNVRLDTVKDVYTIVVMRCINSQRIFDEMCADIYSAFGQQKLEDSMHPDSFSFAIPEKIKVKHMSEKEFNFDFNSNFISLRL